MKTASKSQLLAVACFVALCVLFPSEARADSINLAYVAAFGVAVLVPLTLFVVLVEGIFLSIGLRIPYRRTLLLLLGANLASLAAGIPVKIFNAWMHSQILPQPLPAYFRACPLVIVLGTAIYFVVTLVVEYPIVVRSCRNRTIPVSLRRIALFVFIANVATYAVLAPLHYVRIRPIHDIREFTDDSKWAQRPPVTLYYINGSEALCSVMTDGHGGRKIVSDTVRDYQYLPNQGIVLYRNGTNDLCIFRKQDGKHISCWKTDEDFIMTQVACGPDGRTVAYLSYTGRPNPCELVLYDVESGDRRKTGIVTHEDDYHPEIAWSESPSILFLKHHRQIEAITIDKDTSTSRRQVDSASVVLSEVYGRFSSGAGWGDLNWGRAFSNDESGGTKARTSYGLFSHLRVTVNGKHFSLTDNFGLLKVSNRSFNDVCVLEGGREVIFDDYYYGHRNIYLLDVSQRKVGRISEGSRFIILSDRYRRKVWDVSN